MSTQAPLTIQAEAGIVRQGIRVWRGGVGEWAGTARALARALPVYNGDADRTGHVVERCRWFLTECGALAALTRDCGMHSSGWWKNPDYERCWHLSLSFRDVETGLPRGKDDGATKEIVRAVYGNDRRQLWCEPPYSARGKALEVWHYRLFMHPDWKTPLLPRGEVYTRDFIPKDWKSWSDAQADMAVPNQGGQLPEGS